MTIATKCLMTMTFIPAMLVMPQQQSANPRAWMTDARIGAYGLTAHNAIGIVRQANASGVNGIEVDNDIPGRYESFLDPEAKLHAVRKLAMAAHHTGNHAFVYIAGLECITANAETSTHTVAKDHPDWLQRKIDGTPAIFHANAAFWIKQGDEDVWISPYAPEWRKTYMERVRQIAATGIDGIYVDVPYWMTHFTGWEDSWASFDDYTVAAFRARTGLDARKDIKLGDFDDPGFQKWVSFRIQTITDFLDEIRRNAVSVNPNIAVIPEVYPGIEDSAVRVGADVYQIYPVVDAVAHEYEFGDSEDHTAASRGELDWFLYQIGIMSFRAFAQGKPTWILNYSWDNNPRVSIDDAMENLAMSELMIGANFWDAPGHTMAGSNDLAERKRIFQWTEKNQKHLFSYRRPVGKVGVYFSDRTRDRYPVEFVRAYQGDLLLLLRNHVQFQIATPRTLGNFDGDTLVLPDVRIVGDQELHLLQAFSSRKGRLIATGGTEKHVAALPGLVEVPGFPGVHLLTGPYKATISTESVDRELLRTVGNAGDYAISAPSGLVAYVAKVDNKTHWFLANFSGLQTGASTRPVPARNVVLHAPCSAGAVLHVVPFLGTETMLHGRRSTTGVEFVLPEVDRGLVAWTEH